MDKHHVHLPAADRERLEALLTKGNRKVRVFKRITGLRALDRGQPLQAVARTLGGDSNTGARWRDNYQPVMRPSLAIPDEKRQLSVTLQAVLG